MNISIKGKLSREDDGWSVEIGFLDYSIKCCRPLLCLKKLEAKLKDELQDENLKCFFKIGDSGIFYILTAQTPEFINFLAEKLIDIDDIRVETNLED